eukprot:10525-Heterococcus_DN1.PRE.3
MRKVLRPGPTDRWDASFARCLCSSKSMMECTLEMNTVQVKFKKRRASAKTASFRQTPSRTGVASDKAVQSASGPSKQQGNHRIILSELLLLDIDQNCIHKILR